MPPDFGAAGEVGVRLEELEDRGRSAGLMAQGSDRSYPSEPVGEAPAGCAG